MKVTVVRHGETIQNKLGICQGQGEGKLSDLGIEQAQCVGERLHDEDFAWAYYSDLSRAVDTANAILVHHPKLAHSADERLRERSFGAIEGKLSPKYDLNTNLPPDAETDAALCRRVASFLREITAKHTNDHVLVVSHGIAIKALKTVLLDLPYSSVNCRILSPNTGVTVMELNVQGETRLLIDNCTAHLAHWNDQ